MWKHVKRAPLSFAALGRKFVSWFQDDVFRRLFINAGKLLSAQSIAAIIGLAVTAMTARSLGAEGYGIIALVMSYQATFGKLVTFNAWQAVVKYGSESINNGDFNGLRQLVKLGLGLDIGSALIGTILAIALSGPTVRWLKWDEEIASYLTLYCMLILFESTGTSSGVLRLFDRFDLMSYTSVVGALVRLLGVSICFFLEQGVYSFVVVYVITGVVSQLYLFVVSLIVLKENKLGDFLFVSLTDLRTKYPGIWDYVWSTNLTLTVRMLSREADSLFIATFVTPSDLGLYKIAKQLSNTLLHFPGPLSQSVYPELARLWASDKTSHFFSVVKKTTLITSAVAISGWLGFVMFGSLIIELLIGPEFSPAYVITVIYMFALVVFLCSVTLTPSMLAIGLVRKAFFANFAATVVYFGLLFTLLPFGVIGASFAYVGFFLAWSVFMLFFLYPYWKNRLSSV